MQESRIERRFRKSADRLHGNERKLRMSVCRALKLREYGLKYRDEYQLYTKKPVCSGHTSFITIGLTECYFALVTMGYGILVTVIVFALELLWHKR